MRKLPLNTGRSFLYSGTEISTAISPLASVNGILNTTRHLRRLSAPDQIAWYMLIMTSIGINAVYSGYTMK